MTKHQRAVERLHLLRTLDAFQRPAVAADILDRANQECSVEENHPWLDEIDALPMLSPQGITAKLNALSLAGLVDAAPRGDGKAEWSLTDKGREAAHVEVAA